MTASDPTTGAERAPGSFRDPAGHVFEVDGRLLRTITPGHAATWDAVVASGLLDDLMSRGLLVRHDELDPARAPEPAHALLAPERVPFVSHPYEWAPAQLRAAAMLTLDVAEAALEHGMVLRDASAYNVQFRGTDPVFIDTLSFAPRVPDEPWVAYGQFCRHFLAPLALQVHTDVRLADLLRTNLDGVPLDLTSSLLPWHTRLRPGLLTHLHAHASATATRQADADGDGTRRTAKFSDMAMRGLVQSLRKAVLRLEWDRGRTTWGDYYAEADHYTDTAMQDKLAAVGSMLDRTSPSVVWDLGANTGRFSRLAAERGATTVALDIDHGAVESGFRALREDPPGPGTVLPLRYDLANPSPGIGWAGRERQDLRDRGPADVVLALALVHHLAIGNNVPLTMVADHLAELGRHAVVEWVPKDDPKVRVLLATREDVFADYTEDGFRAAFQRRFDTVDEHAVADTGRVLFLLRSR